MGVCLSERMEEVVHVLDLPVRVRSWCKGEARVSMENEERVQEKLSKRLCACIITRLPASCFRCCSGHSICQADLVGSEMCHKGALMDEAEHGANDAPTPPSNEGPHAGNNHL